MEEGSTKKVTKLARFGLTHALLGSDTHPYGWKANSG